MMKTSALIVSIGEKTVQDAIESVNNQSVTVEEIVHIENVSPVHKAELQKVRNF